MPAHEQVVGGKWNVAEIAKNAYDIEGKVVGTIGAGRIGQRVLQRLQVLFLHCNLNTLFFSSRFCRDLIAKSFCILITKHCLLKWKRN